MICAAAIKGVVDSKAILYTITYKNLLVRVARRYSPSMLEQAIAERALAMVNMRNDAKVSISFDRNRGYSCFELGRCRFPLRRKGSSSNGPVAATGKTESKAQGARSQTLPRPCSRCSSDLDHLGACVDIICVEAAA